MDFDYTEPFKAIRSALNVKIVVEIELAPKLPFFIYTVEPGSKRKIGHHLFFSCCQVSLTARFLSNPLKSSN